MSNRKLYRILLSDPDGERFEEEVFADSAQAAVDAMRRVHDLSTVYLVAQVVLDWH